MAEMDQARRKQFGRVLAENTPLIEGKETRKIGAKIKWDTAVAADICAGRVVPFEPRNTFYTRLIACLATRKLIRK